MDIINKVLNIIYPPKCILCRQLLIGNNEVHICFDCLKKLPFIKERTCLKCGKKLDDRREKFCYDCISREHYFDRGISVFEYKKPVSTLLIKYKANGKLNYTMTFAKLMAKKYCEAGMEKPDIIIPVPIHCKAKKKRGYNQSELLAKAIKKIIGVQMKSNILIKIKTTNSQKKLQYRERLENLKDAFEIKKNNIIKGKNVLLIDDVYTTGATVDECSKLLKQNGAEHVFVLTFSIGNGF